MRLFESAFHALKHILKMVLAGSACRVNATGEDVAQKYRDAYTREVANDHAYCASDVGRAVHQYASQPDPAIRAAVDLAGLTAAQADWLLSLKDCSGWRRQARKPANSPYPDAGAGS